MHPSGSIGIKPNITKINNETTDCEFQGLLIDHSRVVSDYTVHK